jgi:hypothetical protein
MAFVVGALLGRKSMSCRKGKGSWTFIILVSALIRERRGGGFTVLFPHENINVPRLLSRVVCFVLRSIDSAEDAVKVVVEILSCDAAVESFALDVAEEGHVGAWVKGGRGHYDGCRGSDGEQSLWRIECGKLNLDGLWFVYRRWKIRTAHCPSERGTLGKGRSDHC